MSNSQVISFRASGYFLNWIEAQREEGESPSQAAMRILKTLSTEEGVDLSTAVSTNVSTRSNDSLMSTDLSTNVSTRSNDSLMSTDLSTITLESVDTQIEARLDPVLQQLAKMEERLGKLRA